MGKSNNVEFLDLGETPCTLGIGEASYSTKLELTKTKHKKLYQAFQPDLFY